MKKILFLLISILLFSHLEAKKIKFAVNMKGVKITPSGVHVAGDFQKFLGLPDNWLFDKTKLTKEKNDTNIYSIVVDLPAFKKYEFKFVNGNKNNEAENVPLASQVGYKSVTNRWIYLDSLANDTTFVGAIKFEGNSPEGLQLVRFKVNMNDEKNIAKEGIYVAGSFQGWDQKKTIMYGFENKSYDIIAYVKPGAYQYKFYNGNTAASSEYVPNNCALNYNRQVQVVEHTVLNEVCFSGCTNCKTSGLSDEYPISDFNITPNPVREGFWLKNILPNSQIQITSVDGKIIFFKNIDSETYYIDNQYFVKGIYFINIQNKKAKTCQVSKFIIE